MSFGAGRGIALLGAATTIYRVDHPKKGDVNTGNVDRRQVGYDLVEIVNGTTGMVFIAFDRLVVVPAGNGVQGGLGILPVASYPNTGARAATPGDFDVAIVNGSWPALDIMIPPGSEYMSIYNTAAGTVGITWGGAFD